MVVGTQRFGLGVQVLACVMHDLGRRTYSYLSELHRRRDISMVALSEEDVVTISIEPAIGRRQAP